MKKLMSINPEKVESILYMIINFGETEKFPNALRNEMDILANDCFKGSLSLATLYIKAQVTNEIFEHLQEYTQFMEEGSPIEDITEYIKELHTILENVLNNIL